MQMLSRKTVCCGLRSSNVALDTSIPVVSDHIEVRSAESVWKIASLGMSGKW